MLRVAARVRTRVGAGEPHASRAGRRTRSEMADRPRSPVVRSKLTPPNLPPRLLPRPGLVHALIDHLDRPLVSIVADAGYGKTTLLAVALRSLRRPVVWYSLMGSHADPMVFVRQLIEAFRSQRARFGRALERPLQDVRTGVSADRTLCGVSSNALG